jgi:hypothetical protein
LVAEIKFLRKENAGLKDEVAAQKGTIATQERLIGIEKERGDFFKTAAEKGIQISNNCGLIQERYDRMVAMYESEQTRLRSENDKLRSSRNTRALFSFGAGLGLGYLGARR